MVISKNNFEHKQLWLTSVVAIACSKVVGHYCVPVATHRHSTSLNKRNKGGNKQGLYRFEHQGA
jgi:hypothetical protein